MSKTTQTGEERRSKQENSTRNSGINSRITTRVVVDEYGEIHREYQVDGYALGSIKAVERLAGGISR